MDSNYNLTPEDRKRLIDSIPEASIIDSCKENIQPRRQGRNVSNLSRVLEMNSNERDRAIQQGKTKFEKQLETIEELDDPLDVYIQQVSWTIEMFPEGSVEHDLMTLLHDATNRFKNYKIYQQDPRYLKLWIEYSKWVEEPLEIFTFLIRNGIGKDLALFYEEYAYYLEGLQKYDEALQAYKLGIEVEATPLQRLIRNRKDLELRIEERRRRGLIKKREREAITQMNELKAQKRTMLGQKFDSRSRTSVPSNVYAGIQSSHSSTSFNNDRFSIPASNPSSSRITVFQDDTSSTRNSSSSRSAPHKPSSNIFRPSTSASSASENRMTVEKFSGAIIPQAEVIRPPVEKFTVYRDPEDSSHSKKVDRNNSSMLSEASTEESIVSKIRKHPTSELEDSKRSRYRKTDAEKACEKRLEKFFKLGRRFKLKNKDSRGKEEVFNVLKTTHDCTSIEEERSIAAAEPYKIRSKAKEPELSGFDLHFSQNQTKPPEVGFTTETRKAIESVNEIVFANSTYDEEEEDLTWTNPIQRFYRPNPYIKKKSTDENE